MNAGLRAVGLLLVGAMLAPLPSAGADVATAIFAGGCFWCMQPPFDRLPGVVRTTVGYTGGSQPDPTYEEVSAGGTGHAEAIRVEYDPSRVGYGALLETFWRNIDPLTGDGQFCDHGPQYRSAIFFLDAEQQRQAEASKRALEASGRFRAPVLTEVVAAGPFYPAEEYHQKYAERNPLRYRFYRNGCGRDRRLEEVWGTAAAAPH